MYLSFTFPSLDSHRTATVTVVDAVGDTDTATIEVLPNVGHWPALEAPDEVNELLRNFIKSP